MSLKDRMAADTKTRILDTNAFAEQVTYTPYGGSAKTIKALVFREDLQPLEVDQNRTKSKFCRVFIACDATYGVTAVNQRFDKISFPEFEEGVSRDWLVSRVISKDSGGWMLQVIA